VELFRGSWQQGALLRGFCMLLADASALISVAQRAKLEIYCRIWHPTLVPSCPSSYLACGLIINIIKPLAGENGINDVPQILHVRSKTKALLGAMLSVGVKERMAVLAITKEE
jgi:hypothetical protein